MNLMAADGLSSLLPGWAGGERTLQRGNGLRPRVWAYRVAGLPFHLPFKTECRNGNAYLSAVRTLFFHGTGGDVIVCFSAATVNGWVLA